ncbi:hypothetical protein IV505_04025 [Pseudomonas fulva]|nr:hypothetical protein [Pseudomonas fulva]MBF8778906.1 hypothetical protein [Pseudomonas fulva]
MPIQNVAPPIQQLSEAKVGEPMFFVVSIRKLLILSLLTFNGYWLFCYWRSWVFYRRSSGEKIWPALRAAGGFLFLYGLNRRIDQQIRLSGRTYRWSPFLIALAAPLALAAQIWLSLLASSKPEWSWLPIAVVGLGLCWTVRLQQAINFCVGDPAGESNSRFTWANGIWMACGALSWLAYLAAIILPGAVSMSIPSS